MAVEQHLRIEVQTHGDVAVVHLDGELDLASAAALEAQLERPEVSEAHGLVLELRALEFIDSTGLRTLFALYERARERGQQFAVTPGSEQVQRLLTITRVREHLRVVESPGDLAPES